MTRIPAIVQTVLENYVTLFNERFPNMLQGLYVHGSIALDAFVHESSDIDFITVTNRRLIDEEAQTISNIHKIIANKYSKPEMDGVYVFLEDLEKLLSGGNPKGTIFPYYNGGQLKFDDYFNFNPVTWWVFKTKGINFLGAEINSKITIQSQQLTTYVLENMNTYWTSRVQGLENEIDHLLSQSDDSIDTEIEWSVLGLLRQFYTLKECDIISKQEAGKYGLLRIPEKWHPIIQEAINIREGVKVKIFQSNKERVDAALSFMKYLINECNSFRK